MRIWIRSHRAVSTLLGTVLALAAAEGAVVVYYLNSWFTLVLL